MVNSVLMELRSFEIATSKVIHRLINDVGSTSETV
jgi:hypothetical protein